MSDKSTAEMHKTPNMPPAVQYAAIHHDDAIPDDHIDEEDEVSCLKTSASAKQPTEKKQQQAPCLSCGENNPRAFCHFKTAVCHRCRKKGYLAKVCCSTSQNTASTVPHKPRCFQKGYDTPRDYCFAISRDRTTPIISTSHASTDYNISDCQDRGGFSVEWKWTQVPPNPSLPGIP